MSYGRSDQLLELQQIIQEISKEIMWVNDREEEELMFDWGDKNIEQYIPRKQESYSVSAFFSESSEIFSLILGNYQFLGNLPVVFQSRF